MKLRTLFHFFMLVLLIASIRIQPAFSQVSLPVQASLGRTNIYTSVYEDAVFDGVLTGVYMRSFHIEPLFDGAVDNAKVTLETPFSDPELKPSFNYNHDVKLDIDPVNDEWKYTWTFLEPPIQNKRADIWMTLYGLEATFEPGFDYVRSVDPILFTDLDTVQTVTIEFTPHRVFYNVHLYVVFEETSEVAVTVEEGSATPDWLLPPGDPKCVEWQSPEGGVGPGGSYTFSVQLNVHNKLYPDPIVYKPYVGSGAFFNSEDYPSWEGPVWDEVLQGDITYAGEGTGGQDLSWGLLIQDENTIRFPRLSAPVPQVWVQHRSAYLYEASIFEDRVPNELLNGVPWRNFHIRPQDGVVFDAGIEMVTPWPPERFPAIDYYPPEANFIVEGPDSGLYTYLWAFGSIPSPEQAAVWPLRTNIPVEFQPGFACQRIWNPWISAHTVTQRLTVIFEPSVLGGVHIQVRAQSTPEASVTLIEDSSSLSPSLLNEEYWLDEENGRVVAVNWAGGCEVGTYLLTVDLVIVNEAFPEPIFYKPSVGIGLGVEPTEPLIEIGPDYVTVGDDIDNDGTAESSITYSGTGSDDWQVIVQHENSVQLPAYSRRLPLMAPLSMKVSGEFDYIEKEEVKIKLAALLTDAVSGAAVSDADVTVSIYNDGGMPLVTDDVMVETLAGTGIYEWQSADTIKKLEKDGFTKGIYLVHVQASHQGGPMASDILEFHIDPPGDDVTFPTVPLIALLALSVSLANTWILWKPSITRRFRRAAVTSD